MEASGLVSHIRSAPDLALRAFRARCLSVTHGVAVTVVSIALTGDLMLQRSLDRKDVSAATAGAYDVLRNSDLAFANLECPLTERGHPIEKQSNLRASPSLAGALPSIGVDVVTVANNHVYDYGEEGLLDTMTALDSARVPYVGIGRNINQALRPHVVAVRGVKIAFLGISCTLPPNSSATETRAGMAPIRVMTRYLPDTASIEETPGIAPYVETQALEVDVQRTEEAIATARSNSDVVVVGIHWGLPNGWIAQFQHELATYQRPLGHRLIEAGAHVLVGNHAHALQGMETHAHGVIFYSLGNFLFHRRVGAPPKGTHRPYPPYAWRERTNEDHLETAIGRVDVTADGIASIDLHPVRLNSVREPELATAESAHRILSRVVRLSSDLGTDLSSVGRELAPLRTRVAAL